LSCNYNKNERNDNSTVSKCFFFFWWWRKKQDSADRRDKDNEYINSVWLMF
jgi:hypothetical protein